MSRSDKVILFEFDALPFPLTSWREHHFDSADLDDSAKDSTIWGDRANPDHDTLPNLVEYFMGLNPWLVDDGNAWAFTVNPTAQDSVTFTYRRSKGVDAGLGGCEFTTDLSSSPSWTTNGIEEQQVDDLGDYVLIEATVPVTFDTKMVFVRLKCGQ